MCKLLEKALRNLSFSFFRTDFLKQVKALCKKAEKSAAFFFEIFNRLLVVRLTKFEETFARKLSENSIQIQHMNFFDQGTLDDLSI